MKIKQMSSAVLMALGMGLVLEPVFGGALDHAAPGATGVSATSCAGGASRNPAGCDGHGVLKYAFTFSGDLRLWDEPTSYIPAYGPWVSLGVSMNSSEVKRSPGTQAGGWNVGLSGYVTTVVNTGTTQFAEVPAPVTNAVQVYLSQGGFETYVSSSACSATSGTRCTFAKDAISQATVSRAGGDTGVLASYPAAVRAQLLDPRGFARALPGGGYEVYGGSLESIRVVPGGYEAWLSARVDRTGLALVFHYDTRPSGIKRVRSLTDASGLETHLYYPDNEPRWSASPPQGLSELLAVSPTAEGLLTSIADPYGHRAEFTYQDAWTGWVLGEPLALKTDSLRAAVLAQSGLFRLIASQDVLGVRSLIRYGCGAVILPDTLEHLRAGIRDGIAIPASCVNARSGIPLPGPTWLDPAATETPYGINRYKRVDVVSDSQHRLGWIVQNPAGNIEWKETLFGTQDIGLQSQLAALLGRGTAPSDRPAHIPVSAWNSLLRLPASAYRTGYQWSFKALDEWPDNPAFHGVDLFAMAGAPAMPPLALAHIEQYAHDYPAGSEEASLSQVKIWEKTPGESEGVYYGYENATDAATFRPQPMPGAPLTGATHAQPSPSVVARRLDDGTFQAVYQQYNEQGNPTLRVDAMGGAQETVYAPNGIDVTDLYAVRWSVDAMGLGHATHLERLAHFVVNDQGQVTREEGTLAGVGTTLDYETAAPYRLAGVTNELGLRTRYHWSTIGTDPTTRVDRLTVTAPNGLVSTSDYRQGAVVRQESQGRIREYAGQDAFGRPATVSVGGEIKVRYTYNPANLLDLQTIRNETNASEVKLITDYLGRVQWSWQTNAMGEVVSSSQRSYDLSGNLASLWTSGASTTEVVAWYYDVQGRPTLRWDTEGSQTQLSYSPTTGRLTGSQDANGQWTYYRYDANGALLSKRLSDPVSGRETVRMEYDPVYGRINRKFDAIGMTEYHYTPYQPYRLEWMEEPLAGGSAIGSATRTRITPTYDTLNRGTGWGMTDDVSSIAQSRVAMRFDDSMVGMGRISQYESDLFVATPGYDPVDAMEYGELNALGYSVPEAHAAYPGMVQTVGHTDAAHDRNLNNITYQMPLTGERVQSAVSYDSAGRVTRVDGLIGEGSRTYAYDERSRLTHASRWDAAMGHQGTKGYSYDPIGNRTQVETEDPYFNPISIDRTVSYGASNRLDTIQIGSTAQAAEHDAAGNMTFNPSNGQHYRWDQENRLIRIDYPIKDAQPSEKSKDYTLFTYDSQNRVRRIQEFESGSVAEDVNYVWIGSQLAQKRRTADQQILQTYNADGYADHNADGTITKYLLTRDYLGSITGKVNATGQILERIDYDAWGEPENRRVRDGTGNLVSADRNTSTIPFGYAGYWKHNRSKLSITAHRFYDAKLGRWLSKDPIAELGGVNLYAYVGNNPVNLTDPSGLDPNDLTPERRAECIAELQRIIELTRRSREISEGRDPTYNRFARIIEIIMSLPDAELDKKMNLDRLNEAQAETQRLWQTYVSPSLNSIEAWNNSDCGKALGAISKKATAEDIEDQFADILPEPTQQRTSGNLAYVPSPQLGLGATGLDINSGGIWTAIEDHPVITFGTIVGTGGFAAWVFGPTAVAYGLFGIFVTP